MNHDANKYCRKDFVPYFNQENHSTLKQRSLSHQILDRGDKMEEDWKKKRAGGTREKYCINETDLEKYATLVSDWTHEKNQAL